MGLLPLGCLEWGRRGGRQPLPKQKLSLWAFKLLWNVVHPSVGGTTLDLHRLFVEVTSRGGLDQRWSSNFRRRRGLRSSVGGSDDAQGANDVSNEVNVDVEKGGKKGGGVEEAAVKEVALKNGVVKEAAVKEGAVKKGAVKEAAVKKGAVKEAVVKKGAVKEAAVKKGAVNEDKSEDEGSRQDGGDDEEGSEEGGGDDDEGSEEGGGDDEEGFVQDGGSREDEGDDEEGSEDDEGDDEEGSEEDSKQEVSEEESVERNKEKRKLSVKAKKPVKDDRRPAEKNPVKDYRRPEKKLAKASNNASAVKIENRNRPDSDAEEDKVVAIMDYALKVMDNALKVMDIVLFDPVSWMFSISLGKEFVISPYDVYDVFKLPLNNGMDDLESTRSTDLQLKQEWRTPVANKTADFSFVKALENVDEIKNFYWCKYVHERLCRAILKYKKNQLPLRITPEEAKQTEVSQVDNADEASLGKRIIKFDVLDSMTSDEEIHSVATDAIHEQFLLMKRNMEVVTNYHLKKVESLKKHDVARAYSSSSPVLQSQDYDPRIFEIVDEIVDINVIEKINLDYGESSFSSIIMNALGNGKAKISVGCGPCDVEFVGHVMKSNKKECLVWFDLTHTVLREDMVSLAANLEIFQSVIECWAMLLNENERMRDGGPQKFCFGAECSANLVKLWDDENDIDVMDQLQVCWKEWIQVTNNNFDISVVDLVFVPIYVYHHFWVFALNMKKKTMQLLDNSVYEEATMETIKHLSVILCDHLSTLFNSLGHLEFSEVGDYAMEEVMFSWKNNKGYDQDCGIYSMMCMLLFEGATFSCDALMRPSSRVVLRAEICATLVLSDMNDGRQLVLNSLCNFNPRSNIRGASVVVLDDVAWLVSTSVAWLVYASVAWLVSASVACSLVSLCFSSVVDGC
uniref:Ubiquitin-like protease family profile domain-containing protein n=1 Tax=Chenopodium quinoa TaxID=63459 RepID=A0A803KU36_CHEQI